MMEFSEQNNALNFPHNRLFSQTMIQFDILENIKKDNPHRGNSGSNQKASDTDRTSYGSLWSKYRTPAREDLFIFALIGSKGCQISILML